MTTKGKIIVTISALVILSGAGYLIYKFVIKPTQDKKKEPQAPENVPSGTGTNTGAGATTNPPPPPPAPVSKYGFKMGDKLFAKSDFMPVYSLPDYTKSIGFVRKKSTADLLFSGDANASGWIKAQGRYFPTGNAPETFSAMLYVPANLVTNLAP